MQRSPQDGRNRKPQKAVGVGKQMRGATTFIMFYAHVFNQQCHPTVLVFHKCKGQPPLLCSTLMCLTNSAVSYAHMLTTKHTFYLWSSNVNAICLHTSIMFHICVFNQQLRRTLIMYSHICLLTSIKFYTCVFNQHCLPSDMCLTNYKLTDGREITINVMQSRISPRIWVYYSSCGNGNAMIVSWEI